MPDDKYDLELFHKTISCKSIKMLNLADILALTSGRNHSSPNESFLGVGSQLLRFLTHTGAKTTIKGTKKSLAGSAGLARQPVFPLKHLEAQISVKNTTLISENKKKNSQK